MLDPSDTIAAIASPPGPALRGIVRLSGPDAPRIATAGFAPDHPGPWKNRPQHRTGRLQVSGLHAGVNAAILRWPGSKTYTGQPSAEIHATGSVPIVERILADCLSRGARLAEPGEFTLRAFLAGRIDLTQAEAVLGVIEARSPERLDAALSQLAGGIAGPIERLRDRLLDVLALMEANLDFADESDVDPLGAAHLAGELDDASTELIALADSLQSRDRPESRPRAVLLGPPNAGKSRLFNALCEGANALVSPEAGTTRDYLVATCTCGGIEVDLIDTAGVEAARDGIEARAGALRDDQAATADIALLCRAANMREFDFDELLVANRPSLRVLTKSDLLDDSAPLTWIATSAATGRGLLELRRAIAEAIRESPEDSAVPGTSARCRDSLIRAGSALRDAASTLTLGGGDELVAIDLRQALDDLGRVVGAIVTDDILDRIFGRFCIGK
jgi:tRNA modification GTPase